MFSKTAHYQFFLYLIFPLSAANIACTTESAGDSPGGPSANKVEIAPVNQEAIESGANTQAIVHSQIVVGDGKTVIRDGCVIISGEKINAVGRYEDIAIPAGTAVVDASGTTLLPGLIDAHFHLDRMDSLPSLFLSHGITSLRDPGAWIEAYEQERASGRPLPRLYLTGPHIDMYPPAYPNDSYLVSDPLEAKAAVNHFANQGASAIKVYFRSSLEIIRAACEAAHQRGLPVTAHLEVTNIYDAVENGINGIEHITSLGTTLIPLREAEVYKQAIFKDFNARRNGRYAIWQNIDLAGEKAEKLGHFLVERKIFLCPTLGAFEYQPAADQVDTMRLEAFQHMLQYTKKLHDMGVPIVVGSHSWVRYSEYGWAYHHEMELFEQLGMTPLEIIYSATLQNARFFGIADKIGTIEKGKLADLLLVTGDPLENIEAMRQVQGVMLAGNWIIDLNREIEADR